MGYVKTTFIGLLIIFINNTAPVLLLVVMQFVCAFACMHASVCSHSLQPDELHKCPVTTLIKLLMNQN